MRGCGTTRLQLPAMRQLAIALCLLVAVAAVVIGLMAQRRTTQDNAGLVAIIAGLVALAFVMLAIRKA